MALGGSPMALVKDIAEGYLYMTPAVLKKYTTDELHKIHTNIGLLLKQVRTEAFDPREQEKIRNKNLRLQRLHQALLILEHFCRQNRIKLS